MSDDILKHHRVPHIPALRVDPGLAGARFPQACSMTQCSGACCRDGVWADPIEQDRILQHAETIQRAMDDAQEKNPARWFDLEDPDDPDFPSGRAVGTTTVNGGCVFLNSEKRCVLQIVANEETGVLKPFYCFAFPITIDNGTLCLDDGRDACCTASAGGSRTVLDLCPDELTHVLGQEGLDELRKKLFRQTEGKSGAR
ncbi:MAG TPA: DUF3109 family protein [Terriglobia bacterium]|nr:DUF3109 family protein [Terriglobia bacterium]